MKENKSKVSYITLDKNGLVRTGKEIHRFHYQDYLIIIQSEPLKDAPDTFNIFAFVKKADETVLLYYGMIEAGETIEQMEKDLKECLMMPIRPMLAFSKLEPVDVADTQHAKLLGTYEVTLRSPCYGFDIEFHIQVQQNGDQRRIGYTEIGVNRSYLFSFFGGPVLTSDPHSEADLEIRNEYLTSLVAATEAMLSCTAKAKIAKTFH